TVSSVNSVTLDETEVTLLQGGSQHLTATVTVSGDVPRTVTWTSSDTSNQVTVVDGLVTVDADAPTGTYYITATSTVDAGKSATATIHVVRVTGITVTPSTATVNQGKTQSLAAVVAVEGTVSPQAVTWTSSDNDAVTVDAD